MDSAIEKFEANYIPEPNSGCWLWTGALSGGHMPYGRLNAGRKSIPAHRFSYATHNGPITNGLSVLHKCDIPTCVNPGHLFLGTARDNNDDMTAKGRRATGTRHGRSKLTDEDVRDIRQSYVPMSRQFGTNALARKYGMQRWSVRSLLLNKTYKQESSSAVQLDGLHISELERFNAKHRPDGECWIWTAAKLPEGHGMFYDRAHKIIAAHRYAYGHFIGPIPKGAKVRQNCGRKDCVNPAHLFVGPKP